MMRSFVGAIVLMFVAGGSADAQADQFNVGLDTHYFRRVLKECGLTQLSEVESLRQGDQATKLLIVLGDTSVIEPMFVDGSFQQFLRAGGAVLIATDRQTSEGLHDALGVRISGEFVTADAQDSYRKHFTECPIVRDRLRPRTARHPIFAGLPDPSRVATNRPSRISENRFLTPIAWLPPAGHPQGNTPFLRIAAPPLPIFAAANSTGNGRLLVLSDHSVFINEMMWQGDDDNAAFAFGVVRWLTDEGKRTEVLFFYDGKILTDFDVPLDFPEPPVPPIEALVPMVNNLLANLERENFFNKLLLQSFGGSRPILRLIAFLLSLMLLLFGLHRFLHSRYRPDTRAPRLPSRLAVMTPQTPEVERRQQAAIALANLAETARELAVQAFTAMGLAPEPDAQPPLASIDGSWWQRWTWNHRIASLWGRAVRGPRNRVSQAGLVKLAANLHELRDAVATGKVRLAAANSPI